jgi:pyrimidine oxygenase
MGLWRGDDFYSERYEYSTEYVEVMQALWATGNATYQGRYFELDDCQCLPIPPQPIPIVCAGQSDRGMQFTAEVGDYNFVLGSLAEIKDARERLDAACTTAGREVGAYALYGIITAPADDEAVALANHFLDGADTAAIENEARLLSMDKSGAMAQQVAERLLARPQVALPDDGLAATVQGSCFPIPHLVGSYERVARHLDALESEARMSGIITTFPDFVPDVRVFGENVLPLIRSRQPARA